MTLCSDVQGDVRERGMETYMWDMHYASYVYLYPHPGEIEYLGWTQFSGEVKP